MGTVSQVVEVNVRELLDNQPALQVLLNSLREIKRRQDHPYYAYTPDDHAQGNQLGFHKSTAMYRLLFGANRSGKSRAAAQDCCWFLTGEHPYQPVVKVKEDFRIWVVSASYRNIQEGIWGHLKKILPEWKVADVGPTIPGGWNIPAFIVMKNGHRVDFLSGEGREDARRKAQGAEIDRIYVDEEIDAALWEELLVRLGDRGGRVAVSATLLRSEQWCLDLEDRAALGDPEVHRFVLTAYRAVERGHMNAKVVRELENTLSAENREVRLEGKSRRAQGLVYKEFCDLNVVEDFDIPPDWTRYCAIDPGWRTCAVIWAAVSPAGKCVLYREHYWHGQKYREISDAIFAAEGYKRMERQVAISEEYPELGTRMEPVWVFDESRTEEVQIHWIDPNNFGHHPSGERMIGHLFAEEGLVCAPARNEFDLGIELCRRSLMPDLDGVPKLRVFRSLTNFLKEIRSYRMTPDLGGSHQNERPGRPAKKNDHGLDGWRYMTMGGLEYVPINAERRSYDRRLRELDKLETVGGMDERLRKERIRVLRRERFGREDVQEHVGGLGTEY